MATAATTRAIRAALISHLKADPSVTAMVPSARIFPQQVPASIEWPYSFLGASIGTPDRASCLDGRVSRLAIHTYARTVTNGPSGESQADDIADAIAASLDGLHIASADMDVTWISNTTIRDPSESSAFHSICQVQIELSA